MSTQIKLTKNELRDQQYKLSQLQKYLPTLQLKKAMLQMEVNNAEVEIEALTQEFLTKKEAILDFASLFSHAGFSDMAPALHVEEVQKRFENIAGVDIPLFEDVIFAPMTYPLYDTPLWADDATFQLRQLVVIEEKKRVVEEKKRRLAKELRDVSIRVNLFEKILIPRTQVNIKKIKVFLDDQELSAVATSKVAKMKLERRKEDGESA